MRLFSEHENKIIKKLVDTKLRGVNAIQHLQAAKILREQFDFFALKWTIGETPSISIYHRHTEDCVKKEEYSKLYFKVADFIYFLKELESNGFIAIQTITKKQERQYSLLYDRKKYKYNESKNEFIPINEHPIDTNDFIKGDTPPFEEVSPGVYILLQVDRHEINLDFANDLERYGLGIIYPLPLAMDYVKNGFQTLEQLQFKKQMETALNAAKWGRIAALFGGISTGIAFASLLLTTCTSNKPTTIDRLDLERIESAIKSNHISEPFEIITNDTLVVKQIQVPSQTIKNIIMNNPLQFPATTIVDRLIPKAQFVKASTIPTAVRTLLANEFEQIRLLYVLRPDTINVAEGNEVKEIDVFLFRCKTDQYSINPFCGIDDLIPRHTIYIIEHGNHNDLLMQHKRRSVVAGTVKWTREVSKLFTDIDLTTRPLQIEGQNLDRVYFNFFSQMTGYQLDNSAAISEIKELETSVAKKRCEVENLQKRVRNEKQFNRQIELNCQARALKREISELENQLSKIKK